MRRPLGAGDQVECGGLKLREQWPDRCFVTHAGRGQGQPLAYPFEQQHAGHLLEFSDLFADRTLRQVQGFAGARHAAETLPKRCRNARWW